MSKTSMLTFQPTLPRKERPTWVSPHRLPGRRCDGAPRSLSPHCNDGQDRIDQAPSGPYVKVRIVSGHGVPHQGSDAEEYCQGNVPALPDARPGSDGYDASGKHHDRYEHPGTAA